MAIQVKHATTATGTDAGNGEIRKSHWNADHVILGAADLAGDNVYTGLNTFQAATYFQSASGSYRLRIDAPNLSGKYVVFRTGSSARWEMGGNSADEVGGNAGSTFVLNRYDDSGTYIDTPMYCDRVTGIFGFSQITISTPLSVANGGHGAASARLAAQNLGTPFLFAKRASAVSVGAFTTEQVLDTVTIPGGAMGPTGYLIVDSFWSHNNNANSKNLIIRAGGVAGTQVVAMGATSLATTVRRMYMINNGSASAQKYNMPAGRTDGLGQATSPPITSAVNTAADWDLVFSGSKPASSGDTVTLEGYLIWIVYGA